jgi:hypothetical protein
VRGDDVRAALEQEGGYRRDDSGPVRASDQQASREAGVVRGYFFLVLVVAEVFNVLDGTCWALLISPLAFSLPT